ncbi:MULTISPECIES: hypothetical protein [unclassified Streptomyces]|uniref:hypothetical protein n=1 Tax=unclassified Streptomyces TaxID=2593676 RepID=UPI00093B10F2|nr:hypothetical protein [Streptomyces sp. TSRI0281]OKI37101.1 hypothetical protein A6A29_41080 [Streptomyces sp. TSRI0281]
MNKSKKWLGTSGLVLATMLGTTVALAPQAQAAEMCRAWPADNGHRAVGLCQAGSGEFRVRGVCAALQGSAPFVGTKGYRNGTTEQASIWDCGSGGWAENLWVEVL